MTETEFIDTIKLGQSKVYDAYEGKVSDMDVINLIALATSSIKKANKSVTKPKLKKVVKIVVGEKKVKEVDASVKEELATIIAACTLALRLV